MKNGKAITYKGATRVHAHDAPEITGWFFKAFAERLHRGNNRQRIREIAATLDITERVVLEFTPSKTISYDGDKLAATIPNVVGGFDAIFT